MEAVTKGDLRDMRDDLKTDIREGFDAITERLDVLNGRVGKSEVAIGQHGVRLDALERDRPAHIGDAERRQVIRPKPEDERAITRRDVNVGWAVLGAVAVVIMALYTLGVWHLGKP